MWITKCEKSGLHNAIDCGLQRVTKLITKCVRDCKVCQGGLQNVTGITKCDGVTKHGGTTYAIFA